ncbi:hypothetical protein GCM10025864_16270 [Luteimicrobium album]|uniref:UspA domain-containing protein n=1 Tax=Luteimicrobium album TaxID=1054550 RepID=A0ABQ6I127_9MICO|nr:universal stress protein [Luteimicrobium album]GMA23868.1 hypothetical protein GCM10025864_16270 [Luteimicrobium album]
MNHDDPGSGGSAILVGVDGSAASGRALDWAGQEAAARECELLVVYCEYAPLLEQPFVAGDYADPDPSVARFGAAVLAAAVRRVHERQPGVLVRTELRTGPVFDTLLRAAAEELPQVQLVVLGREGIGAVGGAFLGSSSIRVAAHNTVPTVVVPGTLPLTGDGDGQRFDAAPAGSVVVGFDGSAHGKAAVACALDEAALRDTGLTVVVAGRHRLPSRVSAIRGRGPGEAQPGS